MMRYLFSLLAFYFVIDFSIAQQEADILLNGVISAEENQIKNLADPTDPNDAANKAYIDDKIFPDGINDGDILVWNASTNSWEITTLDNNVSNSTSEVETVEATNITFNSANSGGVISTDGGSTITEKGIVWSENPDPTVDLVTKTDEGGGASNFESIITGLNESTQYFYRAYSTNSTGTSYGNTYLLETDSAGIYDQDDDGFTPNDGDCDDYNASVYPGADEIIDQIDNDCDGEIDEDDIDLDGYTTEEGDCDDNNPNVYPNAYEICDGVDNSCNGFVDMEDVDNYFNGEFLVTRVTDPLIFNASHIADQSTVILGNSTGSIFQKTFEFLPLIEFGAFPPVSVTLNFNCEGILTLVDSSIVTGVGCGSALIIGNFSGSYNKDAEELTISWEEDLTNVCVQGSTMTTYIFTKVK